VCLWLEAKGIQNTAPMGQGGVQTIGDIAITMVNAVHGSSVVEDGRVVSLGQAAGYVIRFEDGVTIYFAGDTDIFGDMRLIAELIGHRSRSCRLAIGLRWALRPRRAPSNSSQCGRSCRCTTGRFPFLTGTARVQKTRRTEGRAGARAAAW
jgi:hypothetical protein